MVSAVNRDTDTKMELGSRILAHSAIWGMRETRCFARGPHVHNVSTGRSGRQAVNRRRWTALCQAAAAAAAHLRCGGRQDVSTARCCPGESLQGALRSAERLSVRRNPAGCMGVAFVSTLGREGGGAHVSNTSFPAFLCTFMHQFLLEMLLFM